MSDKSAKAEREALISETRHLRKLVIGAYASRSKDSVPVMLERLADALAGGYSRPEARGREAELTTPYHPVLIAYDDPPRLEYVTRDVATVHQAGIERAEVLLDIQTQEVVGFCLYGADFAALAPSTHAGGDDA